MQSLLLPWQDSQHVFQNTEGFILGVKYIVFLGFRKRLLALGKKKSCYSINEWMKSIINHLYWCAASSHGLPPEAKVEKWKSITRHIANIHCHDNEYYPNCVHGDLGLEEARPVKWMRSGMFCIRLTCSLEYRYIFRAWLLNWRPAGQMWPFRVLQLARNEVLTCRIFSK